MTVSRGRIGLARALAVGSAIWWGFLFFGLIDLMTVVIQDDRFYRHYLLESGWGLLYLVLVTVPFLVLVVRPTAGLPLTQVLVVAVAVAAAAALAGYPRLLLPAVGLGLTGAAVGCAAGTRTDPAGWRRADLPLVLLALAAVPAGWRYAWAQAHGWRDALDPSITNGLDHRPMQAALGLAVPLVAGLAAVAVGARLPLWRVPLWTAAFAAVWLGVESVVYPGLEASLGTAPGVAAACWGVALAVVAEARSGRRPARRGAR